MARIKPKALLMQSKVRKGPSRIGLSTIVTCNLVIILIVLSIYATYRHWHPRSRSAALNDLTNVKGFETNEESTKLSRPGYAVLDTAKASITIELYNDASTEVLDRFVDLCKQDYFKGMPFDRVIKNYVIQGGDFDEEASAQDWILKEKVKEELSMNTKDEAFKIGTSKNPSSKGFNLFITTAPIPNLNDKLLVFGRVVKGENVVQEIEEVDTDEHYQPKTPIGIINITLKRELYGYVFSQMKHILITDSSYRVDTPRSHFA